MFRKIMFVLMYHLHKLIDFTEFSYLFLLLSTLFFFARTNSTYSDKEKRCSLFWRGDTDVLILYILIGGGGGQL
jgi:hypothetical protein